MRKSTLALLFVVVVLFGSGALLVADTHNISPQKYSTVKNEQVIPTTISYIAEPGKTSLQQLQESTSNVITKNSKYGEYVSSINNHNSGDGGKYWSFYIDGKLSDVGAGSYIQKGGELIVWKFQKL